MTVAKITSGSSNEKVTELREFLLAGERHETFDLQMENDFDEELGRVSYGYGWADQMTETTDSFLTYQ